MNKYYIYIYLDPRKSEKYKYGEYEFEYEPFYVGKGKNNRIKNIIGGRSDDFIDIINEIKEVGLQTTVIKLFENLSEGESFKLETKLIDEIGRLCLKNGPLINKTSGGQGGSGYKWTEEKLKKRRKNFSEIRKEFERRKYILLTEEKDYKNCETILKYICPEGHNHSISWNGFQREQGCPYCAKVKIDFSNIKNKFEDRNYILLTEEKDYKNANDTKLNYICPEGHRGYIKWRDFKQGCGCPFCAKNKINFSDIKKEFEKRNYILLSEEKDYKKNNQKLKYICPEGHEGSISWNSFQQNHNCFICWKQKMKGKNSILIIQDVIQIKLLLKEGILTQQEIADIFGVDQTTISLIKSGKIWNYIELEEVM